MNSNETDGCTSSCTLTNIYSECVEDSNGLSHCLVHNNGVYENNTYIAEGCDDGNVDNGDGCTDMGVVETDFTCYNTLG